MQVPNSNQRRKQRSNWNYLLKYREKGAAKIVYTSVLGNIYDFQENIAFDLETIASMLARGQKKNCSASRVVDISYI